MPQRVPRTSLGGRTSSIGEARSLFALWSALSGGSSIDVRVISNRLGISETSAKRLIDLLATARGGEDDFLPLSADDENMQTNVRLSDPSTSKVAGTISLTAPEYAALTSALNTLGVGNDDPLRLKLAHAANLEGDFISLESLVTATITAAYASREGPVLLLISEALADSRELTFSYRGAKDTDRHERRVVPYAIRHKDSRWYLEAFDTTRQTTRTFRVDRMSDIHIGGQTIASKPGRESSQAPRLVEIEFHDRSLFERLDWPDAKVIQDDTDSLRAVIPYYESSSNWLVRRITSSGGAVTTSDPALRQHVADYANKLLVAAENGR